MMQRMYICSEKRTGLDIAHLTLSIYYINITTIGREFKYKYIKVYECNDHKEGFIEITPCWYSNSDNIYDILGHFNNTKDCDIKVILKKRFKNVKKTEDIPKGTICDWRKIIKINNDYYLHNYIWKKIPEDIINDDGTIVNLSYISDNFSL
jgi:hypothetical protein